MTTDSRLRDYCDMLNTMGWVRASGDPYVIRTLKDKPPEIARRSELPLPESGRR